MRVAVESARLSVCGPSSVSEAKVCAELLVQFQRVFLWTRKTQHQSFHWHEQTAGNFKDRKMQHMMLSEGRVVLLSFIFTFSSKCLHQERTRKITQVTITRFSNNHNQLNGAFSAHIHGAQSLKTYLLSSHDHANKIPLLIYWYTEYLLREILIKCGKPTVEFLIQSLDLPLLFDQTDGVAVDVRGRLVWAIHSDTCKQAGGEWNVYFYRVTQKDTKHTTVTDSKYSI